jgi:hypothetical protein
MQGSWEDVGRQTAFHCGDTVIKTGIVFKNFIGISPDEALAYYAEIETIIPESIKEQMQGLAQGLTEYWSVPYDTAWQWVLITNLGIDILNKQKLEEESAGCTAFAIRSAAGTFLCHNTDNTASTMTMGSLMYFRLDNGDNAFLSFFSPAFVGASLAINAKGLALTYNVGGRNKNPAAGLPVLFKTREIMATCGTIAEAVAGFQAFLDAGGIYGYGTANFLVVDFKDSSMARIQVCTDALKVTYAQELKQNVSYIGFTNEFDDDFSPRAAEDLTKESVISSQERYKRLMELLSAFQTYDRETCWNILQDSSGGEPGNNTICRRGDSTITTLANIFTASMAYYAVGPPCEYREIYGEPVAVDLAAKIVPSITGTVSALGRPLAGARVVLKSAAAEGIELKATTDAGGAFSFNNLITGRYEVRVKKFPHLPRRVLVDYQQGQEHSEDIKLLW